MRVRAVIGAGLGDEGKGRLTEYFSDSNSIVVRFNGGAQAGHTVALPDGKRHVFHHFGAGTLHGAATYLSKFFISNPMFFVRERQELLGKFGENPNVFVSPFSFVTTPWDMIINELTELKRGNARHGSCGFGINETVERSQKVLLNVHMLGTEYVDEILEHIVNVWVPQRVDELDLEPDEAHQSWLKSKMLMENFKSDIKSFLDWSTVGDPEFEHYDGVVFEGAQGLMLDQNHENFPHVTRSNTGTKNVRELVEDFRLHEDIEVTYVTRSYATRHGEGPLKHYDPNMSYGDPTNKPNKHQGSIRFGLLDINQVVLEISKDMVHLAGIEYNPSIAVTCLDQNPGHCIWDGKEEYLSFKELCIHALADKLQFSKAYGSIGPRTNDHMAVWERKGVPA